MKYYFDNQFNKEDTANLPEMDVLNKQPLVLSIRARYKEKTDAMKSNFEILFFNEKLGRVIFLAE